MNNLYDELYLQKRKNLLITFLIFILFFKINCEDCNTHSFPELNYLKAMTLSNGYKIMITKTGIYSFYPKLSTIAYSYNYTGQQKIPEDDSISYVYKAGISQYSGEDGENQYVLCIINHYLYVMNEKGKVLFSQCIFNNNDIDRDKYYSLVAYKFSNGIYYFVLGYSITVTTELKLFYFQMNFQDENNGNILLLKQWGGRTFFLSSENISCHLMKSDLYDKILTCFIGWSTIPIAKSFNPDDDFPDLFNSNELEVKEKKIQFISSSINHNKTQALVCTIDETPEGKCFNYKINENLITELSLSSSYCSLDGYGLNTYFFEKANEYIFSCVDDNNHFFMKRINLDFEAIEDSDIYNGKQFINCENYSSFSIVYISQYKQYSVMINAKCNENDNINIFMLSDNCIMPSGEIEEDEDEDNISGDNKKTEFPPSTEAQVITTIPIIETTIIVTTQIITSIPRIETSLPIIRTTSPKIITTLPEVETSLPITVTTSPKIITTLPKIETTTSIKKTEKIEVIVSPTESLCKEVGKIYVEGNCVCDTDNEYYIINSKNSDNKCYKKSELPKNVYYNEITKSYELCYKNCGTCIMGGDFSNNNCLDCALNFIKEPENKTSNCVESCKFLYYYNILGQYSCTEDEQCPNEASLIIRNKAKCINRCINDDIYKFQYNGECLLSCPTGTEPKDFNICQISNVATCSSSDFKLNLNETIVQENVKLVAKNYANEFYYTENHITRFSNKNFTMVLYKNSSCIDELKMNVTKIEYDSCIEQLKKDNDISETRNIIIAVIDLVNGDSTITTYGFFNPDSGEKLDAAKSCSDKSVMMYENILNVLNEPSSLILLKDLKINIFDLNSEFYNDICFHFDSPYGKDATLQDRIKTFYPNITLCDSGCKNKGINMSTYEAECECTFQDLLSKSIFQSELLGDNILVKETLQEIMEIIYNLNLEILACYKDIYNFNYFIKNVGGFIITGLILIQTICIIYFYTKAKYELVKYIYSLTETFIMFKSKNSKPKNLSNPLKRKANKNNNLNKGQLKRESNNKISSRNKRNLKRKLKSKQSSNSSKIKTSKESFINETKKSGINDDIKLNEKEKTLIHKYEDKNKNKKYNIFPLKNKLIYVDLSYINNNIDYNKYIEQTFDESDYDEVIEEDKRSFCEYLRDKIIDNQLILNIIFVKEEIKPRAIKITILILTIDLFFLINGLFYSDSYISEVFNLKEKETFFSFVPRSTNRFFYTTVVGSIIGYIIRFSFVEEIKIKKIFLKERINMLSLRYEMSEMLKEILKKINILVIINYFIVVFSWYYIYCFNNVYPNIKREWIWSSIFIIIIHEVLPIILGFFETCIRFISIKFDSEKLFKLSLLFP